MLRNIGKQIEESVELVLIETSTMQILLLPSSRNYACCMSNTERSVTVVACCFLDLLIATYLNHCGTVTTLNRLILLLKRKLRFQVL